MEETNAFLNEEGILLQGLTLNFCVLLIHFPSVVRFAGQRI